MVWNRVIIAVVVVGNIYAVASAAFADDDAAGWPPSPDRDNTYTKSLDGRTIERFTHQSRTQWGYKASQQNYFFLVHPKQRNNIAPLCVVLHSAGRTAFDFLGYHFLNRKVDPDDNPNDIGEKVPADFYGLFLESNADEWWGWSSARDDGNRYANEPTPAENRVLDTVEWVARKYNVDRNRIYLTGVSMGGCGCLAIGLPHGDVFAAMRVWVPAGTGYASCRMGFAPWPSTDATRAQKAARSKKLTEARLPDPPLVVDLSAPNDAWSRDQAVLLNAAREEYLPLVVGWGPFGHTGSHSPVAKYPYCAAVLALPWMEIRKNEAYPVFTHTSSDQHPPWLGKPDESDESGQINAHFRWKSVMDTPLTFAMRIWLEYPAVANPLPNAPKESVSDITLRRLQKFKAAPDRVYAWRLIRGQECVASGTITPNAAGLLTVPRVTITTTPVDLCLSP
jgi:hypothetical protein